MDKAADTDGDGPLCLIVFGDKLEAMLNEDVALGRTNLAKRQRQHVASDLMHARSARIDQFSLHIIEQLRTRLGPRFPRPGTPVQFGHVYLVDHNYDLGYRLIRVRPRRGIDPCVLRLWSRPRLYAIEAYLRCDVGQAALVAARMGASRVTAGKPNETTFHSALLIRTNCSLAPLLDEVCREINTIGKI
jgi:hypothetical protein